MMSMAETDDPEAPYLARAGTIPIDGSTFDETMGQIMMVECACARTDPVGAADATEVLAKAMAAIIAATCKGDHLKAAKAAGSVTIRMMALLERFLATEAAIIEAQSKPPNDFWKRRKH